MYKILVRLGSETSRETGRVVYVCVSLAWVRGSPGAAVAKPNHNDPLCQ